MNGPVAKAGSILYLLSTKGINVPKIAATTITVNNEILTTKPKLKPPKTVPINNMMSESNIPFKPPQAFLSKSLPKSLQDVGPP